MTVFDITYNVRIEAKVEAKSLTEAEALVREAHANAPLALYINGEDVIYDSYVSEAVTA